MFWGANTWFGYVFLAVGFLVDVAMPVAPAVITGWICGRRMSGINQRQGLKVGVGFGIVAMVLQRPLMDRLDFFLWWNVGISHWVLNFLPFVLVPAFGIVGTWAVCHWWNRRLMGQNLTKENVPLSGEGE